MKKPKHPRLIEKLALGGFSAILLGALVAASFAFYTYINEQLYQEGITQLTELGTQLFEKLELQIDMQWSYLSKMKASIEGTSSWTVEGLKDEMAHMEWHLAPEGKTIMFRAIDEDGHYYTDEGRQGYWTGNDYLSDEAKESFLITNWADNENYMAFVMKNESNATIEGKKIERVALLRSMTDLTPFFHSSAFDSKNLVYLIDRKGYILFKSGELDGISFGGKNIFSYLEMQTYPHESYASLHAKTASGQTICSDIEINGDKFFILHDPMSQYSWEVITLVSANDVATSASAMVQSIAKLFLTVMIVLLVLIVIGFVFINRIGNDHAAIKVKEEAQKKLEQTNEELTKAKQEADEALKIARKATKAKSEFLASMSHDIRTPMNAIVGISKLMEQESKNPEKMSYYLSKLHHSSEYMLGLINDILDMSKIESGDVHLNAVPVKMAEQVGQIESIIRSQSNEKNQKFTVEVHTIKHEYLIGDSVRLRQLFMNLLSNAVKYTQPGGEILFELEETQADKEGYARIITRAIDNGYGMSKEFQKRMFEPFAREENTLTNKVSGTGLGLSITKSVVELMGGTIECESDLGKGSRFTVTLELPIDQENHSRSDLKRLLLISKDEQLIANVSSSLSEREVEFIHVGDEREALIYLKSKEVDVILLSDHLRKNDLGHAVASLKAKLKKQAFVFCCDYAHNEHVGDLILASGIDGLIARPFFFENLLIALDCAKKDTLQEEAIHSFLKGKRFLCAEDNELNAEILEALLALHGASCKIYSNGEELVNAFASISPGEYDALLMDVQMPVMNGLEATKAIREGPNHLGKEMIIIAMTANAFSSDVEACLNAGMDAHLSKPLDVNALEHLLQKLLGEREAKGRD